MRSDHVYFDILSEASLAVSLVIWRDIMVERLMQISNETLLLGQSCQKLLENIHNLINYNNANKAFLTRVL